MNIKAKKDLVKEFFQMMLCQLKREEAEEADDEIDRKLQEKINRLESLKKTDCE